MRWIIIFLLANFWPAVYAQTWIGTYSINSTCPTATCCCITNQVLISRSSPNYFGFNISLAGSYCFGLTYHYSNITDPNSYTMMTSISIITQTVTLTVQLSNDSSTLTISNSLSASCDAVAVRQAAIVETTTVQTTTVHSNAVPQYVNIIIFCSLVFFGIVMSF